jgi:hypothetical protein
MHITTANHLQLSEDEQVFIASACGIDPGTLITVERLMQLRDTASHRWVGHPEALAAIFGLAMHELVRDAEALYRRTLN